MSLKHHAVLLQGQHGILAFTAQPVIIPVSVRGQQVKESLGGVCACALFVGVSACFSLLQLTNSS